MKHGILIPAAAWFLAVLSPLAAETFVVKEVGVSLTTPEGWTHARKDEFGFALLPPPSQQNKNKIRMLRIHLTSSTEKTLEAQLQKGIDTVTTSSPAWGSSADRKRFLGSSAVRTESGLKGIKGAFGYGSETSGSPCTINKYYFRNSAGKIFCVCAYVYGDKALADECEAIVLKGLKLM